MTRITTRIPLSTGAILLLVAGCAQQERVLHAAGAANTQDHVRAELTLMPDQIEWAAAPEAVPAGAELAVLDGNPGAAEPFVVRLRMPDGYRFPAHSHPHGEWVTVIQGTVHLAMGDRPDEEQTQAFPPGSFIAIPAGVAHIVWVEGETVIQVTGIGPLDVHYLDTADDPRGDEPAEAAGD